VSWVVGLMFSRVKTHMFTWVFGKQQD